MALVKSGDNELEISGKNDAKPPKKEAILDEDTYIKVYKMTLVFSFQQSRFKNIL